MTTQVGKLHRNRMVKDMQGNIIDWFDEAGAGWIVRGRQVVNKEAWQAYLDKQKDKQEAAKAAANPKIREDYPETKDGEVKSEDRVSKLEKKVEEQDAKLDAILKAVSK